MAIVGPAKQRAMLQTIAQGILGRAVKRSCRSRRSLAAEIDLALKPLLPGEILVPQSYTTKQTGISHKAQGPLS
jgi:hypothetical protein